MVRRVQHVFQGRQPLGQPGAFVEQRRDLAERREVDFRLAPAPLFEASLGLLEETGLASIAEKLQVGRTRHGEGNVGGGCSRRFRPAGVARRLAATDLADSVWASAAVSAKIETQSSDGQAGTTPSVLSRSGAGLRPTTLLHAAGTRPEPAVSVPSAKATSPAATATAEPELEPPAIASLSNTLRQAPYGLRSSASPVAN